MNRQTHIAFGQKVEKVAHCGGKLKWQFWLDWDDEAKAMLPSYISGDWWLYWVALMKFALACGLKPYARAF